MNTSHPLDSSLQHLLLENMAEEAMPTARSEALLSKLQARIADDKNADSGQPVKHVAADAGAWDIFVPGIQVKLLHRADGVQSYLLKLAPGSALPPHRHSLIEECIVLEGSLCIRDKGGDITATRGTFHLAPAGKAHAAIRSDTGALIYLRGAVPDSDHVSWMGKGVLRDFAMQGLRHWFQR